MSDCQELFKSEKHAGCGIHLNPNSSDLRCGDRVNNLNWNPGEGVVQLCSMCRVRMQNMSLMDALNRRMNGDQNPQATKL